MVFSRADVLKLVMEVCREEKLRVCLSESLKGGLIAGTTAAVGGLLGGARGLALGGAVGGLVAAYMADDDYKSAVEIIMDDLTPEQRDKLLHSVTRALINLGVITLPPLLNEVTLPADLKHKVAQEIVSFFNSQLKMKIQY